MEMLAVSLLIIIFVFLNSLVYLAGIFATPAGMVFLGTVHWPGDYFYYLSQFAQGRASWFTSFDLYTNDFLQKTWVGWVNVFLGHLFSLAGINHFLAYQLSLIIFAVTFLGLSYMLIREIFPHGKKERIIAFLLFTGGNAFPKLISEGGRWSLSYYDFWFNMGIPFNRLGGVPHHLIARSVIVLSILLFVWFARRRKWIYLTGLLLSGFILGSIDPVQWGVVVVILFFVFFISLFKKNFLFLCDRATPRLLFSKKTYANVPRGNKAINNYQLTIINFLPIFFFFLGGLPMVLYLKNLFTLPPYSQLAVWEATQQLHPGIAQFILGNGSVMVLAIVGIFFFARKVTLVKIIALLFTFLTIFLYFSSIPEMLGVVNVRFLPATTTLFLACMATETIIRLSKLYKIKLPLKSVRFYRVSGTSLEKYVIGIILFFILLLSLAAYRIQLTIRTSPDTKNGFFYITKDAYEAYTYAAKISTTDDTFLVMWPFNWSFPAVTGRRVFVGHTLLTTDFERKDREVFRFLDGKMNESEAQTFFHQNKITYVITYPWTPKISTYPFLERVKNEGYLAIYRVKQITYK